MISLEYLNKTNLKNNSLKKIAFIIVLMFSFYGFSQDFKPTYEKALAAAEEQKKPLIVMFTGSDWCPPCIRLDKKVLKSEAFISYSKENYILYRADFPKKKENKLSEKRVDENAKLAEKYNPKGHFPLVVVLDSKENILGKMSYKRQKSLEYISLINTFVK